MTVSEFRQYLEDIGEDQELYSNAQIQNMIENGME